MERKFTPLQSLVTRIRHFPTALHKQRGQTHSCSNSTQQTHLSVAAHRIQASPAVTLRLAVTVGALITGVSACTIPTDQRQQEPLAPITSTLTIVEEIIEVPTDELDAEEPASDNEPATGPHPELAQVLEDAVSPLAWAAVAIDSPWGATYAGNLTTDVAWSTSKIPLSIAALNAGTANPADVYQAITVSDNGSAANLWQSLGAGESASAAVAGVIGDPAVWVPAYPPRPGFSAFGQTEWSLGSQAVFGSRLPCIAQPEVWDAMGQIVPDQSYGLGLIPGARFKGGWGPMPDGSYLVRQFGVIPAGDGFTGIAIAVRASDYGSGQVALSTIANTIRDRALPLLVATGCES